MAGQTRAGARVRGIRQESNVTSDERLDEHLTLNPHLAERIFRQLLVALHERGIVTIDQVYDEARKMRGNIDAGRLTHHLNPNIADAPRGDHTERELVNQITREYAVRNFRPTEIDDMVNLTLKREEADKLRAIVTLQSVSFRLLADAVRRFCALPEGETQLMRDEAIGIRVGLIRHLISDQLEFIAIAKKHLRIRDFEEIINRTVGPEGGMGRVGGKAAGMFLAATILGAKDRRLEEEGSKKEPARAAASKDVYQPSSLPREQYPIAIPESYYLRSDVIEDFLAFNRLGEYQNQKYKTPEEIHKEYPLIKSVFRNADFPAGIVDQLRNVLQKLGDHPLIVRSSSLLEDRFGTAFSGKYASLFVANQGTLEQRLNALLGAIAEVYASALGPDPLLYRRQRDLIDYVEDMAVLIQKVVGKRFGPYYAPAFAGVAFSRNEYRWSPRIRREDGLVRLVMGLGTRAVDRVGSESPRMVALGIPTLRHESSTEEIMQRAQRTIDVINLETNRLESITLEQLLPFANDYPLLDRCISLRQERMLVPPMGTYIQGAASDMFVTFDKLVSDGVFAEQMRMMLRQLETAYGVPVDIEFAHDGEKLYILQCRTLTQAAESVDVPIPANISPDHIIFSAEKFVRSGVVENVEYIIIIDPRDYDKIQSSEERVQVARVVGRLNERLKDKSFVLIGPGRWGSNDIRLGVPVTYCDINRSRMLIEVARERDGYVPEVSYGTHFFQDLMEAGILYLPLYPDERQNHFNEAFLHGAPNVLPELVPDDADLAHVVRAIHVPTAAKGLFMHVVMNGSDDRALAYLSRHT